MNNCVYCGCAMHPERPFNYCMKTNCYKKGFKQAEYYVLGVHKSTPIVCGPNSDEVKAQVSFMNTK
jgi:hypothetical protein